MNLVIDGYRAAKVGRALLDAYGSTAGFFGQRPMPEEEMPNGVVKGSLEHLVFLTLTESIDYQRDAVEFWRVAKLAYEEPSTRFLFDPRLVHEATVKDTEAALQRFGMSKKPKKDAWIWRTVAVTFHKKCCGDPRNFLADCNNDALTVLERLATDTHPWGGRLALDFPYLRGSQSVRSDSSARLCESWSMDRE